MIFPRFWARFLALKLENNLSEMRSSIIQLPIRTTRRLVWTEQISKFVLSRYTFSRINSVLSVECLNASSYYWVRQNVWKIRIQILGNSESWFLKIYVHANLSVHHLFDCVQIWEKNYISKRDLKKWLNRTKYKLKMSRSYSIVLTVTLAPLPQKRGYFTKLFNFLTHFVPFFGRSSTIFFHTVLQPMYNHFEFRK